AGETIDYGPCAFMNNYHPGTVFSSIDTAGRYAYGNQPNIAAWNLAVLANALLPLAGTEENRSSVIEKAQTLIDGFSQKYHHRWLQMMRGKLGWVEADPADRMQIQQLLDIMMEQGMDYTNTFRGLLDPSTIKHWEIQYPDLKSWLANWQIRIETQAGGWDTAHRLMKKNNPAVIPRNHIVEEVLEQAVNGNPQIFEEALKVFAQPYMEDGIPAKYLQGPPHGDETYQTFCGT
ncbi:MAG: protein adenylyltransferase SelO family protein, partial [Saprospiraceae bacterium]